MAVTLCIDPTSEILRAIWHLYHGPRGVVGRLALPEREALTYEMNSAKSLSQRGVVLHMTMFAYREATTARGVLSDSHRGPAQHRRQIRDLSKLIGAQESASDGGI